MLFLCIWEVHSSIYQILPIDLSDAQLFCPLLTFVGSGCFSDDFRGDWRKLHNEELHNLFSLPNIRMMRWVEHVAGMGRLEMCTKLWFKSLEGMDHFKDLSIDGRIILKSILGK
jgi:hypothetical protein